MVFYVNRSGRLRTSEPSGINPYEKSKRTVKGVGTLLPENIKLDNEKGTFVNPLGDYGWKKLVSCPSCKQNMNSLLGAIIDRDLDVRKLHIRNHDVKGSTERARDAIFDSYCSYKEKGVDHLTNGVNDDMHFIVEMQSKKHPNLEKRLVYYQSSLLESLGIKGPKWKFNLPKVYTICFVDFEMFPDDPEYIHFCGLNCGSISKSFTDIVNYIVIELPKFNKTEYQLETLLDKWLYILKNMRQLDHVPEVLNSGIFKTIFEKARIDNFNKNQKAMYNRAQRKEIENESVLQYEIAERIAENDKEHVLGLLQKTNLSHQEIANSLGVPLTFVEKMAESLLHSV